MVNLWGNNRIYLAKNLERISEIITDIFILFVGIPRKVLDINPTITKIVYVRWHKKKPSKVSRKSSSESLENFSRVVLSIFPGTPSAVSTRLSIRSYWGIFQTLLSGIFPGIFREFSQAFFFGNYFCDSLGNFLRDSLTTSSGNSLRTTIYIFPEFFRRFNSYIL